MSKQHETIDLIKLMLGITIYSGLHVLAICYVLVSVIQ